MRLQLPLKIEVNDARLVVSSTAKGFRYSTRQGGKPAADKLTKPVKPRSKRAAFLRWFLDDPMGRTVGACMANFSMTRQNVFAYWTMIHRDHGVGYTLSNNTITAVLPKGATAENIFGPST